MAYDVSKALRPGDSTGPKHCIFQEIGPRGGATKNYIALPAGKELPETGKQGNLWRPVSIHDLHAGIS